MARKTVKDKACDKKNDEVLFPKVEKVLGGASYALMKLMEQSYFAEALKRIFYKNRNDLKLDSLVIYTVLSKHHDLNEFESFAKTQYLPWGAPLNKTEIDKILSSVKPLNLDQFFNALLYEYLRNHDGLKNVEDTSFVVLDSAASRNYGQSAFEDSEIDDTYQLNYLLLCDALTGAPIFGKTYEGNRADTATVEAFIENLSEQLDEDVVNTIKQKLVFTTCDLGEDCVSLKEFLQNENHFVIKGDLKEKWILDEVDKAIEANIFSRIEEFKLFFKQYMHTTRVDYTYKDLNTGKQKTKPLLVHMFFDEDIHQRSMEALRQNVVTAKDTFNEALSKQSNSDTKPNLGSMQYFIDKYCNYEADGKVLIDNQKYQDKLKYKGIKVLITDCIEDAQQAYLAYNCQQTIANNFQKAKFSLKDPRSSVGSQQFVNGKLLIDLIASSLENLLLTRIREYEGSSESYHDKIRLTAYSKDKLLAELNTIMLTSYEGGYVFDEIKDRYQTFYHAIGVEIPNGRKLYLNIDECEIEEEFSLFDDEEDDPMLRILDEEI